MRLSSSQIEAIEQKTGYYFGVDARMWSSGLRVGDNQHGFTLIELVMTMVVVGILAVAVAPRFFDQTVFQARGFADQVQAALRYAQKQAIAQRGYVCVAFTSTTLSLSTGTTPACGTPFPSLSVNSPASSVTISSYPASLYFDALGQSNAPATVVAGGTTIYVEAVTGYVHQ